MRRLILFLLLLAAVAGAQQQTFHYPKADRAKVVVHKDIALKPGLLFDLYRPAAAGQVPVVIFANVGSANYRSWPVYVGWAEAVASHGMAAVIYQATGPGALADFDELISVLKTKAADYAIDPSRVVVWSASANVQIGLPVAMDRNRSYIRGAVVYYGDAPVDAIRSDLPLLFVRAGLDSPGLNQRIDKLLARALEVNAPWTIENNAGGLHGFEILNDTDVTRLLIDRTISFMQTVTKPAIARAYASAADDAALGAAYARGEWQTALEGYRRVVAARPSDGEANLRLGVALLRTGHGAEALASIEKAWSLGRGGANDVGVPAAEAAAAAGNVERALHWLGIVLGTPFGPPIAQLRTSPAFAPIRGDARFGRFLDDIEEQRRLTAELTTGDAAAAMRALRQTKSERLRSEAALLNMAYAALSRDRVTEAIEVFRMATGRYASSANAWESLSEAYEKAGRRQDAASAAKKALSLLPGDATLAGQARENVRRAAEERLARVDVRG